MRQKIIFILNLFIIVFTIIGTVIMILHSGDGTGLTSSGLDNLKYYTVLSNEFCGIVAVIRLIGTLRKKGEDYCIVLKFIAATVTGLTFLIIAAFLAPLYPDINMYENSNLWFHLIIPITAMLEFILLKIDRERLPFRYSFFTMIPSALYGLGYMINILVNGIGEWPDSNDWYGFLNWGWPVGIGIFVGIIIITWLVACVLMLLSSLTARFMNK